MRRRLALGAITVTATAVLLGGCTADNPDEFNEADSDYASNLISHHAQTLALLDLTLGRDGLNPQVGNFADQARSELFAEVKPTEKRLKGWGEKVPKTALEHTHDDSITYDTSIPGVLGNDEMHALEQTKGSTFEQAWLRGLIAHEQGAVQLANDAAEDGQNAEAVAFALKDKQAHEDRITALRKLVRS